MEILGQAESELERLARSFRRHLRAENKAAKTIETYMEAVNQLIAHLATVGVTTAAEITRAHIETFMVALVETRSAATANNRFRALRQFIAWLLEEEYLVVDPMAKMKVPRVPEQPVRVLTVPELKSLLATCNTKSFEDQRDEAIIRLLVDTGVRRDELVKLRISDVYLDERFVEVLGKGGRRRQAQLQPRPS